MDLIYMDNPAARFFFALIGILLVLSLVFNRWINKELVETVKPSPVLKRQKPQPAAVVVEEYDMNSDYPPIPTGGIEVVPAAKLQERVIDKKIIYEMPTSNKFLLQ